MDLRGSPSYTISCEMATCHIALWSDAEVKALIAIWGEERIQEELDGAVRNKVVYTGISRKMEQGYNRDWEQCRTKIKELKEGVQVVIMVKQEGGEKPVNSTRS